MPPQLPTTGDHHPSLPSPRPVILRKTMTWTNLLAYFHTQSSLYAYQERFPQDRERPDGDIAQRFCRSLKEGVSNAGGQIGAEDQIEVEWPMAVILARRI
jgi:trans-aconitate 3-methyltransferase